MPRFIVDMYLDGYENEEEMSNACKKFLEEQLDFSGSSAQVIKFENNPTQDWMKELCRRTGLFIYRTFDDEIVMSMEKPKAFPTAWYHTGKYMIIGKDWSPKLHFLKTLEDPSQFWRNNG